MTTVWCWTLLLPVQGPGWHGDHVTSQEDEGVPQPHLTLSDSGMLQTPATSLPPGDDPHQQVNACFASLLDHLDTKS